MIYHLTTQSEWDAAQASSQYEAASLASEGFIHASTTDQIVMVANAFYLDVTLPILLCIEETALKPEIKWEPPAPPDGSQPEPDAPLFPHIYGAINLDAVSAVKPLPKGDDGLYYLPDGITPD